MDGQIREHLAVDFDFRLHQPVDQDAVRQTMKACSCVDTGNPECPELALLLTAIAVGVLACLDDCLLGCAEDLASGVVVALRLRENFLVTAPGHHATFYS